MPAIIGQKQHQSRALSRGGFITPLALVAAIFLFIIGMGLLTIGFHRHLYSISSNHQLNARTAADYGLTQAVYEMNLRLNAGVWDDSNLPAGTNLPIPGNDATYSYAVSGDMWTGYSLQATGRSASHTKTFASNLRLKGLYEYALLTKATLDLVSFSNVDWFNYTEDDENLKIGTTSISPDAIVLKPNSSVNGDLLVGQGGVPADVIDNQGATITGGTYPVAITTEFVIPTAPGYLVSGINKGMLNPNFPLTESGRYENIRMNNGEVLTVTGNVEIYVTNNIELDNNARIDINPGSKLTIFLDGSIVGLNGSGFNNLSDPNSSYPAGDPHKLTVFGTQTCTSIILKNSSEFCGTIYAPNADVQLFNAGDLYGSIISNSYYQKNSGTFWYDATLRDATLTDKFVRFVPTHWREL